MGYMEVLIILSVAVSHLSVMLWGKGTDEFVTDSVQIQVFLGKSKLLPGGGEAKRLMHSNTLSIWIHPIAQRKTFT